ncbi:hypothetical protein ANRL4_02688 [Anaerolineae bacterium]|nr:hypothetical protein ANRL4_02688 [Anaerolineae bacterium]
MMARTTTLLFCLLLSSALLLTGTAHAEDVSGTLCVSAYEDANRSTTRESGEKTLVDIHISLLNDAKVIVANHILTDELPYCFRGLPPAAYYIQIGSPQYESVEATPISLTVTAGVEMTREFPAALRPAILTSTESILYLPATVPVRLALSALGAALAMGLFAGAGLVLYGVLFHRRGMNWQELEDAPHEESEVLSPVEDDLPVLTRVQRASPRPTPAAEDDSESESFGSQYDVPK